MKRVSAVCALFLLVSVPGTSGAGSIERACLGADRPNASKRLCSCIQKVANSMLTNTERSKVAKFFKDPHASQATRQSDRKSDEAFWLKYEDFGGVVGQYCS